MSEAMTPTQSVVSAAAQTEDIQDLRGRTLRIRNLNILDQTRLLRAIGGEQSGNQVYVRIVQAAAAVSHIDGRPLPAVTNERQIDARLELLGDEGMLAVSLHQQAKVAELEAKAHAMLEAEEAGEGAEASTDPLV